jgi:F-box domain
VQACTDPVALLPEDVLMLVSQHLGRRDLAAVRLVCRKWRSGFGRTVLALCPAALAALDVPGCFPFLQVRRCVVQALLCARGTFLLGWLLSFSMS